MPEFLTFSKFQSNQEAQELLSLLESSKIEFKIESERNPLDDIYTGPTLDPLVVVKIPQDRFVEVNKLLLQQAQSQLNDINPDYYLFQFSDQELLDVLTNSNEWNHFDQALAQKILSERSVEIPPGVETAKASAIFTPYRLEAQWLVVEYLLSILFAYVGVLIGLATLLAYKTLNNGQKVKLYDEATRNHAVVMLVLGMARVAYHYSYLFLE